MHQEFEAPQQLQDTISCFWYDSRDYGPQLSGFEVVPDGYAELIFHFGSGCSIADGTALRPLASPFMVGLLHRPAVFFAQGRLDIISIRCYPWAVFDLLGLPSGHDPVRTLQHPMAGLQPALQQLVHRGDIPAAIDQVRQYFLAARSGVAPGSMLHKAGEAMRRANGTLPVSQVAAAAHATVRTLERKFKQSSGHTVKDVSGLMRFEQARNRLWLQPRTNLAGLALELGYADQAHLSREFKRYSGSSPAAFARKAKLGKQAISTDFVAIVPA